MVEKYSVDDRSTVAIKTAATLACLAELTETAISIILAADGSLANFVAKSALVASAVDAAIFVILVCSFALLSSPPSNPLVICCWLTALAVWISGSAFSLVVFSLAVATSTSSGQVTTGIRDLALAGLGAGALGLIPQATLAILVWPQLQRRRLQSVEILEQHINATSAPKHAASTKSVPLKRVPTMLAQPKGETSPRSMMEWPESPTSFLRDSVRRVISPIAMKIKTTPPRALPAARLRPTPPNVVRYDGFETWDTSSVAAHYDKISHSSMPRRSMLETIPGSRPMSLLNALDNLEPEPVASEKGMPLPDSPTYPVVSMPFRGNLANFYPSLASHQVGSGSSSNSDRSHVHPLSHMQSNNARPVAMQNAFVLQQPKQATNKKKVPPRTPRPSQSAVGVRSPSLASPVDSSRSLRAHGAQPQLMLSGPTPQRYGSQLSNIHVTAGNED